VMLFSGMGVATAFAGDPRGALKMGPTGSIIAIRNNSGTDSHTPKNSQGTIATIAISYPAPRLAGFQPLVAITTSSKRVSSLEDDYEHRLESTYDCDPNHLPDGLTCGALNPGASQNFVVGVLDSGSIADLLSGIFADVVGLTGGNVTENTVPIGGVGGTVNAHLTFPLGFYAAGLSAVDAAGQLDTFALIGHSNSVGLVAPPIICDDQIAVTGFIGTPLIAFYNTIIRVDQPRRVTVAGISYKAPDVQIQDPLAPIPAFSHAIALDLEGPVSTASYFPDFLDVETPMFPTALSLAAGLPPSGAIFYVNVLLRQGPPDIGNLPIQRRFMLDTGAQASIISRGVAAELSLPVHPDFTVDVCGVNGVVSGVGGYYIDYIKMNALGGALEFSKAPFIVEDLPSPDGGALDGIVGMNFFWNRNVILEPSLTESSFFHVSDPILFAFGDYDADRYVDADDAFFWSICRTAPAARPTPDCLHLDGDEDGDIDLLDFALFQRCFGGPEQAADPACR